ncbi:MAG: ATP-dependent RNA helicase HrpA [Pseudomonadota bacterium]
MQPKIEQLTQDISRCMLRDRQPLRRRLRKFQEALRAGKAAEHSLQRLADDIRQSAGRLAARMESLPVPEFPQELPVNEKRAEIAAAIAENQVVIVCGETGSGKTTQLPKICLELKRGAAGMIGHTQPRRIAARSVATRIAAELKSEVGGAVGYQVRFTDRVGERTCVKVMTDGILLAETQGDRLLEAYDTIIVDEAHERSLNIDFLLGYLKQILPRRPELKLIVTSATIDAERFSRHFNDAPVIEVSGRTYPVEVCYRPLAGAEEEEAEPDREQAILAAVDELSALGGGDILVFLPGEREIRDTAEALRKHHPAGAEILPLYARMSAAEQDRVFKPSGARRIVLATNVAETSLTVPGIRYVIDPGYARISRYSFRAKVERLQVEKISRASAAQRAGRCGRVAAGVCIRLYAEEDFLARPAFTDPEIRRTNLAAAILRMKALGLGDVANFPFLDPPDSRAIGDGFRLLEELGAVNEQRELTALGRELARLPLDPRISRMILAAKEENCLAEVLVIAAGLSVQDPRERPVAAQAAADAAHRRFVDERSDFLGYLKLWAFYDDALRHRKSNRQLARLCQDNFLSYLRMREWRDIHGQLRTMATEMGLRPNQVEAGYDPIHRALLAGLLGNIGFKGETQEYQGARGIKFHVFPGSALFKRGPKWLMAAELTETARLYARTAAKIEPEWAERLAGQLCRRSYFDPHWEKKPAQVAAFERVTLYGLVLQPKRRVHYGPLDPALSREIFIRAALVEGEYVTKAPFFEHNRALVAEIEELEHKSRRQGILVDEQRIFEFYDALIPQGIFNGAAFDKWRREAERANPRLLFLSRDDLMRREAEHVTENQFPSILDLGGSEYRLAYHFEPGHPDDGVTLILPLAALNQIPPERCEWLVPGLLREKITWLIRSLPQQLRRAFVPVPDFVKACMEALEPCDQPLAEALGAFLRRLTGVGIPAEAWALADLPGHLRMNFRVVDERGKTLAAGRDLGQLRRELGGQAQQSFQQAFRSSLERDKLTRWDFGDLPEQVSFQRNGQTLTGYPALTDHATHAAIRIFDSRAQAERHMRAGLARLLLLQLPEQARFLEKSLPIAKETCLHYLPLGSCDQLKQELMALISDQACVGEAPLPRTAAEFEQRREVARAQLVTTANQLCKLAGQILAEYHAVGKKLAAPAPAAWKPAYTDAAEQLRHLVYPGFLNRTPHRWLQHFPRYLKAIALRLEKLPHASARDAQHRAEIAPLWQNWLRRMEKPQAEEAPNPALEQYRWMLEELRVSLFAQELKTAFPVSAKRLLKLWEEIG